MKIQSHAVRNFVRNNTFKAGLNLIANKLSSVSNVINEKWLDMSMKTFKFRFEPTKVITLKMQQHAVNAH